MKNPELLLCDLKFALKKAEIEEKEN